MHIRSILLVTALSTAACAHREAVVTSPTASTTPHVAHGGTVLPGTRLVATLDTPIGTDVSRVGDPFYATLQTPIVDQYGAMVIPAGSKIIGRVDDLRETRGGDPAIVSLEVVGVQIGSMQRPFQGRIIETEVESTGRHVSGRTVGGSAAGGAVLGAILGGGSGALKGAAVGAGAGTAISLGTSKTGARMPSGTTIAIETTAMFVAP
jgi:hypothetical protein